MRALTLPYALVFAKARDTGVARQWWLQQDDELWREIKENVAAIAHAGDPWKVEVERAQECQWCGWRSRCWGEDLLVEVGEW